MKSTEALEALRALAQEARLDLFRRLVRAGPAGLAVGELRAATGLPGATLTNHLNVLRQATLVRSAREGRVIRCIANYAGMDELIAYLLENCCAGSSCTTATSAACAPPARPTPRRKR